MALVACKECGSEVSTDAKACPKCGATVGARQYGCGTLVLILLVGLLLVGLFSKPDFASPDRTESTALKSLPPLPPGAQWSYRRASDSMSKGIEYEASVLSSNTVKFDSPYGGAQRGTLTLRTHPRYGRNVIFTIERGQILCRSDCAVLVRFDDAPPVNFSGRGPSDNSTETLFIMNYSGFVERMMKSKQVRLSPRIYQEGSPVFEFDVSGFARDRYIPKGKKK